MNHKLSPSCLPHQNWIWMDNLVGCLDRLHVKKNTARGPTAYLVLQPSKVLKRKKQILPSSCWKAWVGIGAEGTLASLLPRDPFSGLKVELWPCTLQKIMTHYNTHIFSGASLELVSKLTSLRFFWKPNIKVEILLQCGMKVLITLLYHSSVQKKCYWSSQIRQKELYQKYWKCNTYTTIFRHKGI